MRRIRNLTAIVAVMACTLTAACSGGGKPATTPRRRFQPIGAPALNNFLEADPATLGLNAPVLATGNTTLDTMPVGTVLPLRQSIVPY